jgi:hypothetical protein
MHLQSKGKSKGPPRLVDRADSFLAKHVASGNARFVIALNFLMPWGSFVTYLAPRSTDSHSPHGGDPRVRTNAQTAFSFLYLCINLFFCFVHHCYVVMMQVLFHCFLSPHWLVFVQVDPMLVKLATGDEAYCRARLKLVRE